MSAHVGTHADRIRWALEAWRWHYRAWFYRLTRERTEVRIREDARVRRVAGS